MITLAHEVGKRLKKYPAEWNRQPELHLMSGTLHSRNEPGQEERKDFAAHRETFGGKIQNPNQAGLRRDPLLMMALDF